MCGTRSEWRAIMGGKAFGLITDRLAFLVVVAALLPASWLGLAGLPRSPQSSQPALSSFGGLDQGSSRLSFAAGAGWANPSARFIAPVVTNTPTPAGVVSGHVTWQGSTQPDTRQ